MNKEIHKQTLSITFYAPDQTTPANVEHGDDDTLILFLNPLSFGNAPLEGYYGDGPTYQLDDGTEIDDVLVNAFGWLVGRPKWCLTEQEIGHEIEKTQEKQQK